MIKMSYAAVAFTIVFILIPSFFIVENQNSTTKMYVRPICVAHEDPTSNICVSCFERSDDSFIAGRDLMVESKNQFKLWELPNGQYLTCEEALQFVDFEETKKIKSEIIFEDSNTLQKLVEKLKIKKHPQLMSKMKLSSQVRHFAAFEIGSEWNAGLNVRELYTAFLSLKNYAIFLSSSGLLFLGMYFFYLVNQRQVRLEIIFSVCIMCIVFFYWQKQDNDYSFIFSYAQGFYLCLCLAKVESRKFIAFLLILGFIFVPGAYIKFIFMAVGVLAFFIQGCMNKEHQNTVQYLGTCLLAYLIIQILQLYTNFGHQRESEIIENVILIVSPVFVELMDIIGSDQRNFIPVSENEIDEVEKSEEINTD